MRIRRKTSQWDPWAPGILTDPMKYIESRNRFMSSREAQKARGELRRHPVVREALQKMWDTLDRAKDTNGNLSEAAYKHEYAKIAKALVPVLGDTQAKQCRVEDWDWDRGGSTSGSVQEGLTKSQFFASIFELTDLWCRSTDPAEYASFLRMIDRCIGEEHRAVLEAERQAQAERDRAAAALEAIRLAELARLADEEEEARRRAIMEADRRALLAQQLEDALIKEEVPDVVPVFIPIPPPPPPSPPEVEAPSRRRPSLSAVVAAQRITGFLERRASLASQGGATGSTLPAKTSPELEQYAAFAKEFNRSSSIGSARMSLRTTIYRSHGSGLSTSRAPRPAKFYNFSSSSGFPTARSPLKDRASSATIRRSKLFSPQNAHDMQRGNWTQ